MAFDIQVSPLFEVGHDACGVSALASYVSEQASLGYGTLLKMGQFAKVGNEYMFAVVSNLTKTAATGQTGPNVFTRDFEICEDGMGLLAMAAWMNSQVDFRGATLLHEFSIFALDSGYVHAVVVMSDGEVLAGTVPSYIDCGLF